MKGVFSQWSHSALIYLLSEPDKGFQNTFIVEARTKGIRIASWRNEVFPLKQFTVGIKRPRIDWYVENAYETSKHDPYDPEDVHGIGYLRHVRGIAVDQINGLFDHKTVGEISAHAPEEALDLLKTATPSDFNDSSNLEWHYVILEGVVWKIDEAPDDYQPEDAGEETVLKLLQTNQHM